jgi:hypothetical protein
MSKIKECRLTGTTSTAGAATINDTKAILGLLYAVEFIDGDLSDGGGSVLTAQNTGSDVANTLLTLANPLSNADAWFYPRTLVNDQAGAALTGTNGGDRDLPVINGVLRLAITSGGSEKTGGCIVYYYE